MSTDALIIGGGPAGLAAAVALRQRGIDCTIVEARPLEAGIDKACGEGLMPDSRETLAQLGVTLTEDDGHLFHGIRFQNPFCQIDARFPEGQGIGVRRPRLHAMLAARAQAAGARLLFDSRVQLPQGDLPAAGARQAMVNGKPLRFRWLIGADGQASVVRKWAGLEKFRKRELRYGFRTHYKVAPWSPYVEVHWGDGGQLYITPVAQDCVCVVYITRDSRCNRDSILEAFPEVAARLAGAEIVSKPRGAVTATCKLQRVANDFVALVGDASGSADAITGEGLALSFRQAIKLAEAVCTGSLDSYNRAHREIGRLPHAMGELMLTMDRWPAFQVRAMRALACTPHFFQELLQVHVGARALPAVLIRRVPRFGLNILSQGVSA